MKKNDPTAKHKSSLAIISMESGPEQLYRTNCIRKLLDNDFNVFELKLPNNEKEAFPFAEINIVHSSLKSASPKQLEILKSMVCEKESVLFMINEASIYSLNESFYSFLGVKSQSQSQIKPFSIRVFPHFLTRGLQESEITEDEIFDYTLYLNIKTFDNVFLRTQNGYPLAYERLYGKKGRVFYIALGHFLGIKESPLIERILKNIKFLSYPLGDSLDAGFQESFSSVYPFQDDRVFESVSEAMRWNTICDEKSKKSIYSHSSIFLPLAPEFYRKKALLWTNKPEDKNQMHINLRQSFASVEIRSTDFCNHDCYYCFNRKSLDIGYKKTFLPNDVHIKLEDDLIEHRKMGYLFAVRYTGAGDPICHKRTIPSLLRFEKAGIPTCLITNGMELSDNDTSSLGENAVMVRFSIDAASADIYSKIRRVPVVYFHRVINNLSLMIAVRNRAGRKGKMTIGTTFLVCRENYKQVYDFCTLIKDIGGDVVWIRSLNDMPEFSEDEISLIYRQIEKAQQLNDDSFFVFAIQFHIFRHFTALHYRYEGIPCWSTFTKAFVQPNGEVVICLSHKEFILGNIESSSFFDIWGSDYHIDFINNYGWNKCSQCIESRYNMSMEFLATHWNSSLIKINRIAR